MADHILDKGYPALATYNASAAAGVVSFRFVKLLSTGFIDLATSSAGGTANNIGVVQESVDQLKVATGKAVVGVRLLGVTKWVVNATPGTVILGSRVMVGAAGGCILATGAAAQVAGIVIGSNSSAGTIAAGDIVDVLLTPAATFVV